MKLFVKMVQIMRQNTGKNSIDLQRLDGGILMAGCSLRCSRWGDASVDVSACRVPSENDNLNALLYIVRP